jgi:AraC-like DNA-binding protein/tetratricopeptide (TPR) repeat protein
MNPPVVPRGLKAAIELMQRDFTRAWTVHELAAASGLARRTLQTQFRRFVGAAPHEFLRRTRLAEARRLLLRAEPGATVTSIASACGFAHLGRFAARYRECFGESPSATLERAARERTGPSSSPSFSLELARPTVAVLPFAIIGPEASQAAALQDEIASVLCRSRWFSVAAPSHARYHLRGTVRGDGAGRLRVGLALVEASTGRYLFADRWEGGAADVFALEDSIAEHLVRAIRPPVRDAEIDRAWRRDPARSTAWELTMRALRSVVSAEPVQAGTTLEWLERAIELAPQDPLPLSLAAWCHSVRASHHQTRQPNLEIQRARSLAERAGRLGDSDPMAEAMLAAAYTLAQDLEAAEVHANRALGADAGSSWGWGRSGWIRVYRGEWAEAIERFRTALALAPRDPLRYLWLLGIASAHFEAARYGDTIEWSRRALLEQPKAITINRLLAPACALGGRKGDGRQSYGELMRHFPGLTIAQVTAALPLTADHLSRRADGLESLGMRPL